jgi:cyclopropane fatty-acyl-phospholipid synthase-like methyltransferase
MVEGINGQHLVPDIGSYNDAIASMYDKATAAQGWSINDFVAERLRGYPGRNHAVLDLGSGTGHTVGVVLEETDVSHITAVDVSSNMLKHLRTKYPLPIVETVESSIEDYAGHTKDTFDIITAIGSLEFVKDLPTILGRLALWLRPNGLMLVTYIQRDENGGSERTFRVPSLGQAFSEYYWDAPVIRDSLVSQGLAVVEEFAVSAYRRGDEMVEYTFISATKLEAAK